VLTSCANALGTALVSLGLVHVARITSAKYARSLVPEHLVAAFILTASVIAGAYGTRHLSDAAGDALLAGLAVCAWTDLRTGLIFDRVLMWCGSIVLLVSVADGSFVASACGALASGSAIALLWALTRGRGIGLGDAKMAALLGAALGATSGLISVGTAFVSGAGFVVLLALARRLPKNRSVALGPFLALGGALAFVWHAVGTR
jgi:leader peptidase (prepilin peptidase)/N-methyltransferase